LFGKPATPALCAPAHCNVIAQPDYKIAVVALNPNLPLRRAYRAD
jgi:hypothetical protein